MSRPVNDSRKKRVPLSRERALLGAIAVADAARGRLTDHPLAR